MNHHIIDRIGNKITFPDARFYKTETGVWVPSVTTILGAYPKGPAYFEWLKRVGNDADEIRDEAGRRGSTVHNLTEKYDEGEEVCVLNDFGEPKCSMREWAMFERYVDFRRRFEPEIMHIELHISSDKLGYAGTLDRIMFMNGKVYIVDIKTSNALYPHYWLQLSSYRKLWEEKQPMHKINGVAILWLNAKTKTDGTKGAIQGQGWQLITRDDSTHDFTLFQATHALWLAENKNLQPKEFVYTLSHKAASRSLDGEEVNLSKI